MKPSGHFPEFPETGEFVSENTSKLWEFQFVYTPLQPRNYKKDPWNFPQGISREFLGHFLDFRFS
jgi:hypothetical protein